MTSIPIDGSSNKVIANIIASTNILAIIRPLYDGSGEIDTRSWVGGN